ncbi:hypothetical protein D3C81_2286070 [compost metagenome]
MLPDLQIIASAQLGVYAHSLQIVDHRLGEFQKVMEGLAVVFGNEAEVEIAEIVIYRPAAG